MLAAFRKAYFWRISFTRRSWLCLDSSSDMKMCLYSFLLRNCNFIFISSALLMSACCKRIFKQLVFKQERKKESTETQIYVSSCSSYKQVKCNAYAHLQRSSSHSFCQGESNVLNNMCHYVKAWGYFFLLLSGCFWCVHWNMQWSPSATPFIIGRLNANAWRSWSWLVNINVIPEILILAIIPGILHGEDGLWQHVVSCVHTCIGCVMYLESYEHTVFINVQYAYTCTCIFVLLNVV